MVSAFIGVISRVSVPVVAATLAVGVRADVLDVPADHATIAEAIVAATDGDEIVVAPGLYVENLNYSGKEITIRSSGGPETTTLMVSNAGSGPGLNSPRSLGIDFGGNRALVANGSALLSVDLTTGERQIISDADNGAGPVYNNIEGVDYDTLGNRALLIHRVATATLFSADLTTGDRTPIVGGGPAYQVIDAMHFDPTQNRVLIVESFLDALFAVNASTGTRTILSSPSVGSGPNMQFPAGVTYNPATNRAYVADITAAAVFSIDLNTGNRSILSGGGPSFLFPLGVCLDAANNRVLVVDPNLDAVVAVDLSTGNRTIVSSNDGVGSGPGFMSPQDLELDAANNRVLIADFNQDALMAVDLATGNRSILSQLFLGAGVTFSSEGPDAVLEGFTLTGGGNGGSVFIGNSITSPTIRNCRFVGNHNQSSGGAINIFNGGTPTITDSLFLDNSADGFGGAITINGGATIRRCRFIGNSADNGGGAIRTVGNATIDNCLFTGNDAPQGGAIQNFGITTIANCTIVGNTASIGGGIDDGSGFPGTIVNSIIRDNVPEQIDLGLASITYCNVEQAVPGDGNIDADPMFVDADGADDVPGTEDDDLRLLAGSPSIDAGNTIGIDACALDLDGSGRRIDDPATPDTGIGETPPVDMGAYEFGSSFVDCNDNGMLDSCEFPFFVETSAVLSPIGENFPGSTTFFDVPDAGVDGVSLAVEATGDFGGPSEVVDVSINGLFVGTLLVDATDCPETPDLDQLNVPAAAFNDALIDGDATVTLTASKAVDPFPPSCPGVTSTAIVRVQYQGVTIGDENGDGVPDACDVCPTDLDGDGIVGPADLAQVLGAWGPNPRHPADFNGDGEVGPADLAALLGSWGACS